MSRYILVLGICLIGIAATLIATPGTAQAFGEGRQKFCITGTSDGSDFTWKIEAGSGTTTPAANISVTGGGTAADFSAAFVADINAETDPDAAEQRDDCFVVDMGEPFDFYVRTPPGAFIVVTGDVDGVSFNPTILQTTVGGVAGLQPAEPSADAVTTAAGDSGSDALYWGAGIVAALAVLAGGALLWRRSAGRT
jgi:uncharacterized protein (TIGR03382 family)